jgi:hypothetical protein
LAIAAGIVFAVLAWSDFRLKTLPVGSVADLQNFWTAAQYRWAFLNWPSVYAVRASFNWGLGHLLMPFYAASFFYSGILGARSVRAPSRPSSPHLYILGGSTHRRGLELNQMLLDTNDHIARLAFGVSKVRWMAISIGLVLLLGAAFGQLTQKAPKTA